MIDLASERLMVFTGKPGASGIAEGPFDMHAGHESLFETHRNNF